MLFGVNLIYVKYDRLVDWVKVRYDRLVDWVESIEIDFDFSPWRTHRR